MHAWQLLDYALVQVCGSGVPRQIRFPRDLSAMTLLEDVELECREVPTCLSSLGHLTSLTLRKLQPSSRAAQSIEAVPHQTPLKHFMCRIELCTLSERPRICTLLWPQSLLPEAASDVGPPGIVASYDT